MKYFDSCFLEIVVFLPNVKIDLYAKEIGHRISSFRSR